MGKTKRIRRGESVLVVIDLQERLMPAMCGGQAVEAAAGRLIRGFGILGAPVVVTQQYTKGLGPTVAPIMEALKAAALPAAGPAPAIEKISFSAAGAPEFIKGLEATGRRSVAICGIEAHVCVMQTALDLIDAGYSVYVAADAISSRKESDMAAALRRMEAAGAIATTSEAILFEMLEGAGESGFKEISALVK
ncbi:MAG: isochorismatase family protein [Clostridiales Family XIII bacterium]|jgi:nicotinamidase-related amidase|nr:isochorismatase family protein [Clostridiales Family XIII bacterium]